MSLWSRLRQSFWFLPALMCVAAVVLAEGLIFVDKRIGDSDLGVLGFVITRVGESGSRDLLGAIAGSMLTVASTTFSITIAVLALSSSTYGPRLVRNFMADRGNQFVLGTFVATFLYSVMVLRSIRVIGTDEGQYFVPHLAVNMAVLLAVLAIGVLVYFIHHISDSVQVSTLAEQVRTDLIDVVDRLFPEGDDWDAPDFEGKGVEPNPFGHLDTDAVLLISQKTGYVLGVDLDSLLTRAQEHDLLISLQVRPGKHVAEGSALAALWTPGEISDELRGSLRQAIRIGRARTPQQDVEFPVLLLEEMAVRALSPSNNDPYTAINALDSLASGLVVLARRRMPSPYRYDHEGQLRVIAFRVSFIQVMDHLLDAMRSYAVDHPTVLHRTLELIAQVGAVCQDPASRVQLDTQVNRLVDAFSATSPQADDRKALAQHAVQVRELLLGSA